MNSDAEMSDSDGHDEYVDDYIPTVREENANVVKISAPPIKLLTENDLTGYLQHRFELAEKGVIHWHPLMHLIFKRYTSVSPLSPKDYLIGLVELILDIPIQLDIVYDTYSLDINDTDVIIPYDNRMFVEARHFVKMMLNDSNPIITFENIRERARKWQQQ